MTVPANGVARLMHFVDARLEQLHISKEEAARRGFPDPSTWPRCVTATPRTPRRCAPCCASTAPWAGSPARRPWCCGGNPLSVTARPPRACGPRTGRATVTGDEVVARLLDQLHDEISLHPHGLAAPTSEYSACRLCTTGWSRSSALTSPCCASSTTRGRLKPACAAATSPAGPLTGLVEPARVQQPGPGGVVAGEICAASDAVIGRFAGVSGHHCCDPGTASQPSARPYTPATTGTAAT